MFVALVTITCSDIDLRVNKQFKFEFEATRETVSHELRREIAGWLINFGFPDYKMGVVIDDVFEADRVVGDFAACAAGAIADLDASQYPKRR